MSLISFGSGVFRSKEAKTEKRIGAPFLGISIEKDVKKMENGQNVEKEDTQMLINTDNEVVEERRNVSKESVQETNEKDEKSTLEKELMTIRRLIFYFYAITSIILIFVLIF